MSELTEPLVPRDRELGWDVTGWDGRDERDGRGRSVPERCAVPYITIVYFSISTSRVRVVRLMMKVKGKGGDFR